MGEELLRALIAEQSEDPEVAAELKKPKAKDEVEEEDEDGRAESGIQF